MQTTEQPVTNFYRTWRVDLYAGWGDSSSATVYMGSHTVTVSADDEGEISAEIDGIPQEGEGIDRAINYVLWGQSEDGRCELLDEGHLTPPAPAPEEASAGVIGKARAHLLHKVMGAAGLPHFQHYAIAAAALGEPWPLETLSDLTETEARTVWRHLCSLYPQVREIGQRVKAKAQRRAAPAA